MTGRRGCVSMDDVGLINGNIAASNTRQRRKSTENARDWWPELQRGCPDKSAVLQHCYGYRTQSRVSSLRFTASGIPPDGPGIFTQRIRLNQYNFLFSGCGRAAGRHPDITWPEPTSIDAGALCPPTDSSLWRAADVQYRPDETAHILTVAYNSDGTANVAQPRDV